MAWTKADIVWIINNVTACLVMPAWSYICVYMCVYVHASGSFTYINTLSMQFRVQIIYHKVWGYFSMFSIIYSLPKCFGWCFLVLMFRYGKLHHSDQADLVIIHQIAINIIICFNSVKWMQFLVNNYFALLLVNKCQRLQDFWVTALTVCENDCFSNIVVFSSCLSI